MKIYPIDFEVVKTLFGLTDKQMIITSLNMLLSVQLELVKDEVSKQLLLAGQPEDEIANVIAEVFKSNISQDDNNTVNLKYKNLLSAEKLQMGVLSRIQEFNKSIYDQYLPNLDADTLIQFNEYCDLVREKNELEQKASSMIYDFIDKLGNLQIDTNTNKDTLINDISQPILNQPYNHSVSIVTPATPHINLGGNISKQVSEGDVLNV